MSSHDTIPLSPVPNPNIKNDNKLNQIIIVQNRRDQLEKNDKKKDILEAVVGMPNWKVDKVYEFI